MKNLANGKYNCNNCALILKNLDEADTHEKEYKHQTISVELS